MWGLFQGDDWLVCWEGVGFWESAQCIIWGEDGGDSIEGAGTISGVLFWGEDYAIGEGNRDPVSFFETVEIFPIYKLTKK